MEPTVSDLNNTLRVHCRHLVLAEGPPPPPSPPTHPPTHPPTATHPQPPTHPPTPFTTRIRHTHHTMFSWLSSLSRDISRIAVEGTPSSSCSSLSSGSRQGSGGGSARGTPRCESGPKGEQRGGLASQLKIAPDLLQSKHALRDLVLGLEDNAVRACAAEGGRKLARERVRAKSGGGWGVGGWRVGGTGIQQCTLPPAQAHPPRCAPAFDTAGR